MQLTWNGTGSAWSTHYGNASAVLEADGQRLLMDCGPSASGRLQRMGLSFRDIDAIFISHLHGDHIYGLEELGFRSHLVWHTRPRLYIPANLALPLWRNVLSGTMAQACDQTCVLRDYFDVTLLHVDKPCMDGPWTLEIHPVRHVPLTPAYGLKVHADGVGVGFTCDSLADADPWFYEGTERVYHDCSFFPWYEGTVHAHFEELCQYPLELREKTWLVHYDDSVQSLSQDPQWQANLAEARMHLTEPFVPHTF